MKKTALIIIGLATVLLIYVAQARALPQGGNVVAGDSAISRPDSQTMHIKQNTDKSIINWQGYSIGANEKVQYFQPGSGSISMNRVVGQDPSRIYGQLSANGQVWVINPNGLLVGSGAKINVGSFLGSTLNISDSDFLGGAYKFNQTGALASIVNQGSITSREGGYVVLISPSITNEGTITANLGKSYLAAGSEVTLKFADNDLIGLTVDREAAETALGIVNKGTISANGGKVIVTAKVASDLIKTVINNEGLIEAKTIEERNGEILLLGGMEHNAVLVSGKLDASAPNGGDGGFIETSAAKVKVADSAVITTYAPYGKTGTWLIDPQEYTIAASGGDMSGAAVSAALAANNFGIQSSGGGTTVPVGGGDINVNDAISWSANTLTLTAARHIYIRSVMTASGASRLALNPSTANGPDPAVTGGTVITEGNGRVDFPGRSGSATALTINGAAYTIINDLGTAGSTTPDNLQGIKGDLIGLYALGADIDASATAGWNGGLGFDPIFSPPSDADLPFSGAFNGLGHKISNLTINRPGTISVGLFGKTDVTSAISNVRLMDVNVTGSRSVGGLVGVNGATINNTCVTGTVNGDETVGGMAGSNSGTINNSYSAATVIGAVGSVNESVGGLVGENTGDISNSYSTGRVAGNIAVGGLVGTNAGNINKTYSAGAVTGAGDPTTVGGLVGNDTGGAITASFWDTQTSGQALSAGGTGKTTAQMKQLATFTAAGWDIDASDGTGTIWRIYEGQTYPQLRSFITVQPPISASVTAPAGWLLSGLADIENQDSDNSGTVSNQPSSMVEKQAMVIQRHELRALLYHEALEELRNNPEAADVPLCRPDKPAAETLCLRRPETKPATQTDKAAKKRKLAVLIGNNDYKAPIPTLKTPIDDIEKIAALLRDKYGYETKSLQNAGKAQIIEALNKVAEEAGPEDSVLLFYAGHGYLMDETKMGYWIPADGSTKTAANWISNNDIARLLQAISARQVMLLSDSCYSGTLTKEQKLKSSRSDRKKDLLSLRSVVAFSSGDEEPVSDEGREGHSIFAWNLIKTLEKVKETALGYDIYSDVSAGVRLDYPQTPQYGAVVTAGHVEGGEYVFEAGKVETK